MRRARARCRRRSPSDAGVVERHPVRVHGVREAALLADLLEQPRRHAAAEHLVQHRRARSGRDRRAASARTPSTRCACSVAALEHDDGSGAGATGRGRARAGARPSTPAKRRLDQLDDLVVLEVARPPRPRRCSGGSARRGTRRSRRAASPAIVSGEPSTSRPSGCSGTAPPRTARGRDRRACRRASGSLRGSPDARSRRRRSRNAGDHTTSERMSTASSRLRVGHAHVEHGLLLGRERVHVAADRLDRLRDLARCAGSVPLNSRCSRKWLAPASSSGSSRAPLPTQHPIVTDRSPGSDSVTTRSPERRRVRCGPAPSIAHRSSQRDRRPRARGARGAAAPPPRPPRVAAAVTVAAAARLGSSAGPRSPNSACACSSQNASNDAVARGSRRRGRRSPRSPRSRGRRRRSALGRRRRRRRRRRLALGLVARRATARACRSLSMSSTRTVDLVAEVEHVLDPVDALAATELRDVQQAVAAREDVDERTELGDVDDAAGVDRHRPRRSAGRGSARSGAAPPRPPRRPSSRSTRCRRRRRRSPRCRRRSPAGSC